MVSNISQKMQRHLRILNSVTHVMFVCVSVCRLVTLLRSSSFPQVWECSSLQGLFFTWPQCTFFQRSAVVEQSIQHLNSIRIQSVRSTSSISWDSWRASLWSWGSEFQWCWPLAYMTTKKKKNPKDTLSPHLKETCQTPSCYLCVSCLSIKRSKMEDPTWLEAETCHSILGGRGEV